jgi:peptidoglycan/LPS O-acetylase OafA/YrhL
MKLPTGAWFAVVLVVLAIGLLPQPLPLKRLYAFVLPVLICVAVFGTPIHRPSVQVFFANPILAHLGRMSYSIYLWQQLATANYGFTSPLIIAVVLVASTFVLAHYSYEFFELPLVKKGNRLAAKYAMARMAAGSDMEEPDELPEKIAA